MHRTIVTVLIFLLATTAFAADLAKTEEQKTLYAIGMMVSRSLSAFSLTPAELEVVKEGLTDSVTGRKPEVDLGAYNEKVQELARVRRKAQGDKMAAMNKDFLDKAAKEKGAVKTASGLVYLSLLAAYFLPVPIAKDNRRLVRWVYMGFAAVTILAWVAIGDHSWPAGAEGYFTKLVELALIALLWNDRRY